MIDFYGLTSPNVQKIFIMLEECGLPYNFKPVDVWASAQHSPDFEKLNPNKKIPVIVDQDGPGGKPYTVFESGAILMYLAEKSGQLMPSGLDDRYRVIQWLMFQMSGVGPMMGQANVWFRYYPEKVQPAIDRYQRRPREPVGCGSLEHGFDFGVGAGVRGFVGLWVRTGRSEEQASEHPSAHASTWRHTGDSVSRSAR